MEVLNDLLGYKNRKIYQDSDYFSFTLDSVLLANFVKINKSVSKILEIGAGTGAVSLILSLRTNKKIDAIEIQEYLSNLFKKSVYYNKLNEQINVIQDDVLNYYKSFNNYYDLIVCNPPYYNEKSRGKNYISRHEEKLNIDNLIRVSKKMLNNKGKFVIVYDSSRMQEIFEKMKSNNLIPKRIMLVHDDYYHKASMFLLECTKNGNDGLIIEPPFLLKKENGANTIIYNKILSGGFLYESEKL